MNVKEWMEIYQIKRSFRYLFDSSPQGHVLIHLMCIYAMVTPFQLHCGGSSHEFAERDFISHMLVHVIYTSYQ